MILCSGHMHLNNFGRYQLLSLSIYCFLLFAHGGGPHIRTMLQVRDDEFILYVG